MFNRKVWIEGEIRAQKYIKENGYIIIDKNCKIGGSEIDIVAILPKKVQKNQLIKEFKSDVKNKKFSDKLDKKFALKVLKNNIKSLSDILVFFEVKARFSKKFGYPFEAVDEHKQHNLVRGCETYMKKYKLEDMIARIDVISVIDDEVVHIENAFTLD